MESIYALKIEDKPTEEQINESVKKQMEQLLCIERLAKKIEINEEKFIELIGKTNEELDLLNNQ